MELTQQAGNDPALVGLMRVYKDYYPDVIVGDTTSGRASVFTVNCILAIFSHETNFALASKPRVASEAW
jgi:hypothetical protein